MTHFTNSKLLGCTIIMSFAQPVSTKFLITRSMKTVAFNHMKSKFVRTSHSVLQKNSESKMSYLRNGRFKSGTYASKNLATDESGKHIHRIKETCESPDCESKKCISLCSKIKDIIALGHYTRDPIAGKFTMYLSNYDANGQPNAQYFNSNVDQTKKITGEKAQECHEKNEIKNVTKMDKYIQDPIISKKLDE